jgi:hypothetical protein
MLKLCEKAVGIPCGAVCWRECCGEAWAATKDWVAIRRAGASVQSEGVVCDARRAGGSCANLKVSVSCGASKWLRVLKNACGRQTRVPCGCGFSGTVSNLWGWAVSALSCSRSVTLEQVSEHLSLGLE